MKAKILITESEYQSACERIYELMHSTDKDIESGTPEGDVRRDSRLPAGRQVFHHTNPRFTTVPVGMYLEYDYCHLNIILPSWRDLSRRDHYVAAGRFQLTRESDTLKRAFYEIQAIKGNWSVDELKRQMGSLLYERTGLSKNKEKLIQITQDEAAQHTLGSVHGRAQAYQQHRTL